MHSWSKQTTVKQSDRIILNTFLQTGKKKEPLEVPTMTHRICQTLAPMWWLALTVCIFPSTLPRRKARLKLLEILVPSKVLIHLLWETYVALDSLWGPKLHCFDGFDDYTNRRTMRLWASAFPPEIHSSILGREVRLRQCGVRQCWSGRSESRHGYAPVEACLVSNLSPWSFSFTSPSMEVEDVDHLHGLFRLLCRPLSFIIMSKWFICRISHRYCHSSPEIVAVVSTTLCICGFLALETLIPYNAIKGLNMIEPKLDKPWEIRWRKHWD